MTKLSNFSLFILFLTAFHFKLFSENNLFVEINKEKPAYISIVGVKEIDVSIGSAKISYEKKTNPTGFMLIIRCNQSFTESNALIQSGGKFQVINIKYADKPNTQLIQLNLAPQDIEIKPLEKTNDAVVKTKDGETKRKPLDTVVYEAVKLNSEPTKPQDTKSVELKQEGKNIGNISSSIENTKLNLLKKAKPNFISGVKSQGIRFEFVKLYYYQKEILIELNINNGIGSDFIVDDIILQIIPKKRTAKSLSRSSIIEKEYLEFNEKLPNKKETSQYIVCKDFFVREDEILLIKLIELNEQGSGRSIELEITDKEFRNIKTL